MAQGLSHAGSHQPNPPHPFLDRPGPRTESLRMTIQNKLVAARRMRSEEELQEVMTSGSVKRIQATCKRAELAGVPQASIDAALAVAEQLGTADGQEAGTPGDGNIAGVAGAERDSGLVRARRLRAEQELMEAAKSFSAKQVEAACKRAEIAGVARANIDAAREVVQKLLAAEGMHADTQAVVAEDVRTEPGNPEVA
uniref:Uncharacterized protein n=1 Tax=Alexandrium monilatum TaxID=311494 RepID=A0A7S4Q3V8_9DINO